MRVDNMRGDSFDDFKACVFSDREVFDTVT